MRHPSSPLLALLSATALLALACGGGDETEPLSGPLSGSQSAPGGPEAAGEPATGAAPDRSAPDPLAGKSVAEICADDTLALIRWDYDQLQTSFSELCCGVGKLEDDGRCELDWPFSDVPSCSAYDALRNGIYARYGYPFQDRYWGEHFGGQPWFQLREDFDSSWLSAAATTNVQRLKELKADKIACTD